VISNQFVLMQQYDVHLAHKMELLWLLDAGQISYEAMFTLFTNKKQDFNPKFYTQCTVLSVSRN